MAKIIKYKSKKGNLIADVEIGWSENSEEIAKREAYDGEYEIYDNGVEEVVESTTEDRIAELEMQNMMLMECLLEMSEIVYA